MREEAAPSLSEREREEQRGLALACLLGVLLFFMAFWMAYHQLHSDVGTDIQTHLGKAQELSRGGMLRGGLAQEFLLGGNCLWYLGVVLFRRLCGDWFYAAAAVTAAAITAVYVISCAVLRRELPRLRAAAAPLGAMTLSLVGPVYMPWYSESIYRDTTSPNVWHNPTHIMVRPFAVLVFWMTVRIYRRWRETEGCSARTYRSRGEAALYTALIAVSVWAKPSFLQAFVPGLGVMLLVDLIRSRGRSFPFAFKLASAYVPGVLLMGMRFIVAFWVRSESGGLGVEIAPFEVWSYSTRSIPVAMTLLLAFPLFVMAVDWRGFFSSVRGQLALWCFAAAVASKALLAEIGERRYHGNFSWGYIAAAGLLWLVAFCHFGGLVTEGRLSGRRGRAVACIGWTLLALHLMSGILYYCLLASHDIMC